MVNVDELETNPMNKNKIITMKEIKERFFISESKNIFGWVKSELSIILENGKKERREKIEFENSLSLSIDFVKFYC